MEKETFEQQLLEDIKRKIVKEINTKDILTISYHDKFHLPEAFVEKAWQQLDWNNIVSMVRDKLETHICNAIIRGMETEVKTDIKKLMSVAGVREKLRIKVYPELMKVLEV